MSRPLISVVIIGRNEGMRLVRCIESVWRSQRETYRLEVIYVDSASRDTSVARAAALDARVIQTRPPRPSAALARNAGWSAARGEFVLFLDGDTVLHEDFLTHAMAAMAESRVGVVWGHRRELDPAQSLYVRVLDLDWIYAPGESDFCGGDALVRRRALELSRGFDETLIAGEEPELCHRLRANGEVIRHIDAPMTGHDLAIRSFRAYWLRAFRAGHAYAEVTWRFRHSAEPLWRRETRRNWVHGSAVLLAPLLLVAGALTHVALAGALLTLGTVLIMRSTLRSAWKSPRLATRLLYAVHSHFQQLPILCGQAAYHLARLNGRRQDLIEYPRAAAQ